MNEPKEPIRNRIKKYIADNEVNRKVKTHFETHKVAYSCAAGAIVGSLATAGVITLMRKPSPTMAVEIKMMPSINGGHHNKIINIYQQRISMYGNVIGRPGKAVVDMTTGKVFASETLAARAAGVSTSMMSNHLNGKRDHISGVTYAFAS